MSRLCGRQPVLSHRLSKHTLPGVANAPVNAAAIKAGNSWLRHRLRELGHERVVTVLVPERTPRDLSWIDLCHELGLVLLGRNEIERAPMLAADTCGGSTRCRKLSHPDSTRGCAF